MTSRHKWGLASVAMVLVAAGLLVWLYRRKPGTITKTIETFVFETKVPESAFSSWDDSTAQPESRMDETIRRSAAILRADDLEQAGP